MEPSPAQANGFLNPLMLWGGGGVCVFFHLHSKKSSGNPYLKILDLSQLFIADARMKKMGLPPCRELLEQPAQEYF